MSRFGKLDILVNNAGIGIVNNVENTSGEEWDLVMDINAKGGLPGKRKAAIPAMRDAGGGSIVNISSIAGITGGRTSAYAASKGAVRLLTKSTAIQYAREGIRCNSVHPGVIDTPMTQPMMLNTAAGREEKRGPSPHEPHRPAGGHRLRRPVPRVGRGIVHDRQRAGDRWWPDGAVAALPSRPGDGQGPPPNVNPLDGIHTDN